MDTHLVLVDIPIMLLALIFLISQNMKYCYHITLCLGLETTPCNKIDKPTVVYRFSGNLMTSITMFHT